MNRINYYLSLFLIDFRTDMFFTKKASFHYYHEIGKHFVCFGQSYNHIPGHSTLIRKDFLAESTEKWYQSLNEC